MKIRSYIDKVVANGKPEEMEKLSDMLTEIIYGMKEHHHDKYEHYKMCLYELAYGKTVNDEMAEEWVKEMKPIGKHWTIEDTTNAMNSMGYSLDPIQFFTVANMMYNDHYDNVKENEELALKLAKDWLNDEDTKQDKLYCYWKHIIKRD